MRSNPGQPWHRHQRAAGTQGVSPEGARMCWGRGGAPLELLSCFLQLYHSYLNLLVFYKS